MTEAPGIAEPSEGERFRAGEYLTSALEICMRLAFRHKENRVPTEVIGHITKGRQRVEVRKRLDTPTWEPRDSDGTAIAAANGDLPVPQDCQARAESIAHTPPAISKGG